PGIGRLAAASVFSLSSGGVAGRRLREQRVDGVWPVGAAELVADGAVAEQAGDAGEGLEVVGAGALGGEQEEDEVDRLLVDGVEVDRLPEAGEQAVEAGEARQPALPECHPGAQ